VNARRYDVLPVRIVVPFVTWQPRFRGHPNRIFIAGSIESSLRFDSAADVMQVRTVPTERFERQVGQISAEIPEQVVVGLRSAVSD
jgi:mRNA interferase MazF